MQTDYLSLQFFNRGLGETNTTQRRYKYKQTIGHCSFSTGALLRQIQYKYNTNTIQIQADHWSSKPINRSLGQTGPRES